MTPKTDYEQAYTLSSLPPLASGMTTLVVGLEEAEGGGVKVYLGARWKRLYVLVGPEHAEDFRRAWGLQGHLWVYPVPPAELIRKDEAPDDNTR